jgi:hypothetical protein
VRLRESLASIGLTLVGRHRDTFSGALVALGVYARRQDVLLAHDARRRRRPLPAAPAPVAMSIMRRHRNAVRRPHRRPPASATAKDRFTGEELQKNDAALFAEYKAPQPSKFLNIESTAAFGLDGKKLGDAKDAKDRTPAQKTVVAADQQGDRKTLKTDAYIPATMAVIYLLILLYFKSIGGYKPESIDMEKITGGINGPMEA